MEEVVNESFPTYYSGKKVFVTGHTGFKGAWFITWLHQLGATVKGYALAPEGEENLFDTVRPHIQCESVIANILDKDQLNKAVREFQPDIIFHLAAQALVRRSYAIPAETFAVNAVGTANLLEAVAQMPGKCTVIVITTDKVYENKETDYHYTENDVLGGYDPYSASKAATEIVVSSFRNSFFHPDKYAVHQKAIASVRAGNVIGGGDWSTDRIIPDIIRSLSAGQPVAVRNPKAVRPWQHVLEPLSGYLQAAMVLDGDVQTYSGAYNFGPLPDDHLPVKDLVETAIQCWGSGTWEDRSDPDQPHEAGLLKLSIEKAGKMLNWHPKLNSREAIEWTINWYRQSAEDRFNYTQQQIKNYGQR
ncbi:MAG: CDP-glucose 4,6-dehydratase [Chitinophagaceae bacterium]|nr:CDP-glucose 4,6-dehydratase [Chitinophagaceae bacterium]